MTKSRFNRIVGYTEEYMSKKGSLLDFDGNITSDNRLYFPERRKTALCKNADISIHFGDLETPLLKYIDEADCIIGCVAWLTNKPVLMALSKKEVVSIVVQKEDFLRPDSGKWFRDDLRKLYARLKTTDRYYISRIPLSICCDPTIDAIRCVGVCPDGRAPAVPRMHHKFLVFCKYDDTASCANTRISEYAVWTGSFNITHNATMSIENSVYIRDTEIAGVYRAEYEHVLAMSEPLNWDSRWISPEYRVGS